jgi:Domain of unknown function (DUF4184)
MPFTFSHPLFSAPLKRLAPNWLSVTGLVLGSMIPDMEYFMAMESYQTIGHSLRGFLVQGVPLSIAFAFAFHGVVKPVLPKFMPAAGGLDRFAKSLSSEEWKLNSVRTWLIFLVSLFIGYWTHMFMDAWTHSSGVFVGWFKILQGDYGGDRVYQLMQYVFSLIGLAVPGLLLARRYIRWQAQHRRERQPALAAPGTKTLLWITAIVFGFLLFAGKLFIMASYYNWVSTMIVAPLSSAIFGIFVACLLHQAARNRALLRAVGVLAAMLLLLLAYDTMKYAWKPTLVHDASSPFGMRLRNHSQTLWDGNLWCWAGLILLGCRAVAANRKNKRAGLSAAKRTPFV